MKKTLLLIAAVGIAFFTSCEKEASCPEIPSECETPSENKPQEQSVGVWHTTHHYFSIEVFSAIPTSFEERIKAEQEMVSSVDVSEAEEYRLSFREDGTGTGSGFAPREQRRYDFGFTWQSSNDELTITLDRDGFGGVLYTDHIYAREKVVWSIEEQTSQKMVLSFSEDIDVDGIDESGWGETHTCRYTFERVK